MSPGRSRLKRAGAASIAFVALLMAVPTILSTPPGASSPGGAHEVASHVRPLTAPALVLNVTLTVTNSQATGTGYYQQLLHLPSNRWASYIAANWSNVNFTYANGTRINSWIEANATNTSTNTLVWVDLANIPATSSATFYMDVWDRASAFVWNEKGPAGIAPQLTASYAKWDDGWRVFPKFYQNFSGASGTPTGWSCGTQHYGGYFNGSNCFFQMAVISKPAIEEGFGESVSCAGGFQGTGFLASASSSSISNLNIMGPGFNGAGGCNGDWRFAIDYQAGNPSQASGAHTGVFYVLGIWMNTTWTILTYNYTQVLASATDPGGQKYPGLGSDASNSGFYYWDRLRSYPPAGVMPSLTLPPQTPTGLHATKITATSITLAWTNPVGVVTNGTLYSTAAGSCSGTMRPHSTGSGSVTSYKVVGLNPGTVYQFSVTAWNSTGQSAPSSCVAISTLPSPVAPTDVHIVSVANTSVTLAWTNPPGPITGDTVYYGTSCSSLAGHSVSGPIVNYTATGLLPSTTYCFGVQALEGNAFSPLSSTVNATTLGARPGGFTDPVQQTLHSVLIVLVVLWPVWLVLAALAVTVAVLNRFWFPPDKAREIR